MASGHRVAVAQGDAIAVRDRLPLCTRDPCRETDVWANSPGVGGEVQIGQDLGLSRIALLPGPLWIQILLWETVEEALDVNARTRIAIMVPDPARLRRALECDDPQALLGQLVNSIDAACASPNYNSVIVHTFHGSTFLKSENVSFARYGK